MTLDPVLPLWAVLPALLLLAGLALWLLIRHRGTRRVVDWAARLLMVLLVLVLAMRPIIPGQASGSSATGGLEVYLAIDTTSSMAAEDYGPDAATRLDGVKADVEAITEALLGAEFAVVTFDSSAVQRVPLTTDVSAVRSANSVLTQEATVYSDGSSVDEPLELLTTILSSAQEEKPSRPRVLFYLGDGEQTREGEPRSFEQLAVFLDGGAVLGYGTAEGGRMREFSGYADDGLSASEAPYIQDYSASPPTDALSRIDEERLRSIAGQLGVDYVHRQYGDPIGAVVAGIDVGGSATTSTPVDAPIEFYWIFAIPLGLLALREALVMAGAIRQLPKGSAVGR